jgi:hypothetical protein
MSEAVVFFEFDFRSETHVSEARNQISLIAREGSVNCVAQWIQLQMGEGGVYENAPGQSEYSTWDIWAYPLSKQAGAKRGDKFIVNGSHDELCVRLWVTEA